MRPFASLNLSGLLLDGCTQLDPLIQLVRLYQATNGKPCRKCPDQSGCKAREIHFKSEGLTNKQLARRDGISLNEVRRRKEAGEYDD